MFMVFSFINSPFLCMSTQNDKESVTQIWVSEVGGFEVKSTLTDDVLHRVVKMLSMLL